MIYTYKIQKAISFAEKAHRGQKRNDPDVPYIIHPLSVALILARSNAEEDIIVAGLLHDVIEDCGIKKEEIDKEFGSMVAEMVYDVTEKDKSLIWEERKNLALEDITKMGQNSILLKSADVLHNINDLLQDVSRIGEVAFNGFSRPKEKIIEHYGKVVGALGEKWGENPLLLELREGLSKLQK